MPTAYPPIALTNTVFQKSREYRGFLEAVHQCNVSEGYSTWPQWCYIPLRIATAAGAGILNEKDQTDKNLENIGILSELLCSTIPWSQHKEIYKIPTDLLTRFHGIEDPYLVAYLLPRLLPQPCIYLDFTNHNDLNYDGFDVHGAFVRFDQEEDRKVYLRILLLSKTTPQVRMERLRVYQLTKDSVAQVVAAWNESRPAKYSDERWAAITNFRMKLLELITCTVGEIMARENEAEEKDPHITKVSLQLGSEKVTFNTVENIPEQVANVPEGT